MRADSTNCCIQCFEDKDVIAFVKEHGTEGDCDFCGAEETTVLPARKLGEFFEPVLNLYEHAEEGVHYGPFDSEDEFTYEGKTLAECLSDWELFAGSLDTNIQNQLLDEIRFGGISPKDRSMEWPSCDWWAGTDENYTTVNPEDYWGNFAEHIKHKRRFLPEKGGLEFLADPRDWVPSLLDVTALEITRENKFYRARIGFVKKFGEPPKPFEGNDMHAPPPEKARRARANPAGIAYLYVAEQEDTAIAEVRAWTGAVISVCEVRPLRNLRIADLTRIHGVQNPFTCPDLEQAIERNRLLNILNDQLSQPVNPEADEIEYVPTQYLAEVILNAGFDGIRYRSAVRKDGTNLVFFEPEALEVVDPGLVEVTSISVTYYRRRYA